MLVAVTAGGQRAVATAQARGDAFHCPECGSPLLVRVPKTRVAHFAHPAGRRCPAQLSRTARRAEARKRAARRRSLELAGQFEAAGQEALFDLSEVG